MLPTPNPKRSDLAYDDDCPVCKHRVLAHPRTLVELPREPGQYVWAHKLCDGTLWGDLIELEEQR